MGKVNKSKICKFAKFKFKRYFGRISLRFPSTNHVMLHTSFQNTVQRGMFPMIASVMATMVELEVTSKQ